MTTSTVIALIGVVLLAIIGVASTRLFNTMQYKNSSPQYSLPPIDSTPPQPAIESPSPSLSAMPFVIRKQAPSTSSTPKSIAVSPSATPAKTVDKSAQPEIVFVNLPKEVASGEKFTVSWKVVGPDGVSGDNTTLKVSYNHTANNNSVRSSVSNNTSQSFGSFKIPQTFSTQLNFSDTGGPINIDVSAIINGQTITNHQTVQLAPQ
jgi:hypothetical protein